uniref:Uncharacterized protein n=1 Tax=Pipistrellus kuhlii TaxID=59472 RepID=A0A7J7YX29_PIPKU|nr:hypothetical protein mPipKuh1_009949 [Pipistrellus kuhlii]
MGLQGLPPACRSGAWTSALLPLLWSSPGPSLSSLSCRVPRELSVGKGNGLQELKHSGVWDQTLARVQGMGLLCGGWDIIHLAHWPQLWSGVSSLTLTVVLRGWGFNLLECWAISEMQEWTELSPSGSR